jgi:hypothetical protein
MVRKIANNYRLIVETAVLVAVLVVLRWALWLGGAEGMAPGTLVASIIAGGVFVMGLMIAGTLSDYREAERVPTDMAAGLYVILRECESFHAVWKLPDLAGLRRRLVAVVTALHADINAGNSRICQAAIEDLSESFLEMENTDVPANYVVRLRQEQAALRKSLLRVYHIQREEFLPSAYVMIVTVVAIIVILLMATRFNSLGASLVTVAFLSFFFIYLLRLLNVISSPFKVGHARTEDDVSLFLLHEFVVQVKAADAGTVAVTGIEEQVEEIEEQLTVVAESDVDPKTAAQRGADQLAPDN